MRTYIGASGIFVSILILTSVVYAAFSDTSAANDNTYASAAIFPTDGSSPDLSPTETPTITPAPTGTVAGIVVINEINWAGSNELSTDEWVELRNMTDHSISIGGWSVENLGSGTGAGSTITIPMGNVIGPAELFLIARLTASESKIQVNPDLTVSSMSLSNAGEQLRLKNDGGLLIDSANPAMGTWVAGTATAPRKSMERRIIPGDGTLAANWMTAVSHTGMDGISVSDEYGSPRNPNGL